MNYRFTAFVLVPLAGLFLLFHHMSALPLLSQGDHGRDLYVFAQTLNGAIPYRDYWWVYGPLMPYYYAIFFKIFGISIPSILAGKLLLQIISGLLIFYSLSLFVPPLLAFIACVWFWIYQPDFFFTFNHIGGICCLMGILFNLLCYIRRPLTKYLITALVLTFLLSFIKVNFGLASLFVLIAFYRVYDNFFKIPETKGKKILGLWIGIITPAIILAVYTLLLFGLPFFEIRQCLPYMSSDQPYHSTPWQSLSSLFSAIIENTRSNEINLVFCICVFAALGINIAKMFSRSLDPKERSQVFFAAGLLITFYFVNLHEYIFSGVLYRSFWAVPFSTILLFLVIGYAFKGVNSSIQQMFFGTLFAIVLLRYTTELNVINSLQIPEQFLSSPRGHIITQNSPQWIDTVEKTTDFIEKNIGHNEQFFALPYDPIYYYLTGRSSPTRQLIFFEHINIPREQERKIIMDLELAKVNFVLISNRAYARQEPGLGIFGKTYCPLLNQYLETHFAPIAQFGDWTHEPGWAWNHGTVILKRKNL